MIGRRRDLSCQQLVELVSDYLDERLTRRERARFERHLEQCDGCMTYVEQLRETIRLSGTLREQELDPVVRESLLAAFRGWSLR